MLKVCAVERGGIGAQLHIRKGDVILSFDGYEAEDEMDYVYAESLASFRMEVKRGEEIVAIEVEKEEDETLGLSFERQEKIKTCHNHCIFCFVDQMPKGMRESLYVKDDDYTMSFACGNFVTLTNLSDRDLERIIRLKISPIYVSVQTMMPQLRCKLLRNRFAGKIVEQIDTLAKGGIVIHAQSVVVPGMNDFDDTEATARKLFAYYPMVKDLALVPTGITKYRDGLYPIPDVDGEYAARFLDLIDRLNEEFGVNFLLPADEYFIKAGRPFKPISFYGEFEQIENGIGMSTKFISEFMEAMGDAALPRPKRSLAVTGTSAGPLIEELCQSACERIKGLSAHALPIENDFFGHTVTCTGLLTGQDMLRALEQVKGTYDEVILSANTMREFEDVFLDGMTLKELKAKLRFKNIRVNRDGGAGFFRILSTQK
ncbi:MAG: DUF512 domain-containing protein [Christensenellaceae bacterium]